MMTLAWDEQCGVLVSKIFPLIDKIQLDFKENNYGTSVQEIWTVLTCRPRDFKQKKRFLKKICRLEYEILLDYFLIKNMAPEQKKPFIKKEIMEITEQTFLKYKFDDFDTTRFLNDFREAVNNVQW